MGGQVKQYDVAVVGAGMAGIAAAVQSAREGKKTVLLEKTVLPGGLATTGLIYIYLPLCDGNGHQLAFGLTEELLRKSIAYGPGDIPDWQKGKNAQEAKRFRVPFSPASFMLALTEMLRENGVDIWYDTLVTGAEKAEGKVKAVFVENESGRIEIRAKCFIDASGTGILARRAGIPGWDKEPNYLSVWALQYDKRLADSEKYELAPDLRMNAMGVPWDVSKAPEGTVFRGISGKQVTDFVLKGHNMLLDYYKRNWQEGKADRKTLFPVHLPAMPQYRKIFAIKSMRDLQTGENNLRFEDSIGLIGDWRKSGPAWEIPYRSLCPADGTGAFLAAGRCIGSLGDAWEVTRVIPTAALTGQAAGAAASLAIETGTDPCRLDPAKVQERLRRLGFPLHLPEVGLSYNA